MNLAEVFTINVFERPLRFSSSPMQPVRVVQRELARLETAHRAALEKVLVSLAHTCFQLDRLRGDAGCESSILEALTIMVENLQERLAEHQVEVRDVTGKPWSAEWRAEVELRGHHLREDLAEPRVAHMELPIVYRAGRCLAKGAAIVEGPRRID